MTPGPKCASKCALCDGTLKAGHTTFTIDFERGVVVIRHVRAQVCDPCGESWIDDVTSAQLEIMVKAAQFGQRQFEVINMTF